jgi:hypothetical protein
MADERMQTGRRIKPVILSSRLPRMTDEAPAPTPIGGKTLLMAAEPKADAGKTRRMPAVRKATVRQPKRHPEMEARATRAGARRKEGYVHLRVRVSQSGRLAVVGAQAVEGPLVSSKLQGALAYEVALGGTPIASGAIPDAGEKRSFPAPDPEVPEMRGHHVTEVPTYEVSVRVPKEQVPVGELPKLEIALYRIKEDLPEEAPAMAAAAPIGEQFERELRHVGRLKGIRPDKLPKPVADQVKKAFR